MRTYLSGLAGVAFSVVLMALCATMLLATAAPTAMAAEIDQAGWADLKRSDTLANGQRIAWVEMGPEEAPPLVLLHGYTDTSRAWSLMAPELARSHRLYILDLRGHGASAAPECCYALADFAYDLKLFMEAKGIKQAALGGHSFGSLVVQRFAAEYPDKVDRLMLFGSTTQVVATPGDALWQGVRSLEPSLDPGSNGFLDAWLTQFDHPSIDREFAQYAREDCLAVPLLTWRKVMTELTDSSTRRFAADIEAPVLIVSGAKDELFDATHHESLRATFPKAEYVLYPTLGHNMIYEDPVAILPAVMRFLTA